MVATQIVAVKNVSHNKEKLYLSNGKTLLAPQGTDRLAKATAAKYAKSVHPDNTVSGDCGSSYITIGLDSGGYAYQMNTGFHVIAGAVEYTWNANISGPSSYVYHYHSSGTNGFDKTWHGQHHSTGHPSGRYSARVESDASYALLDDGTICFSGGPCSIHVL